MVNVKPILKKALANIVKYFETLNGTNAYRTIKLEYNTTLLKFTNESIIIKLDIVQKRTYQHMVLDLLISSNGRILFMGELEGDDIILNRIADNIYFSLKGLMEVYLHDNQRNSQIKSTLRYS